MQNNDYSGPLMDDYKGSGTTMLANLRFSVFHNFTEDESGNPMLQLSPAAEYPAVR